MSHPTQKPLFLIKELIKRHCRVGGMVLDPFFGSGTTGIACLELKRHFIGIEIDEDYAEMASRRLKEVQMGLFA